VLGGADIDELLLAAELLLTAVKIYLQEPDDKIYRLAMGNSAGRDS
jgi:hypothetical protein